MCLLNILHAQQKTTASYYHDRYRGKFTHSGEIYDDTKFTCASNRYKFGTLLQITNLSNMKSVVVKVNDTGELGDSIDLTKTAFKRIANLEDGRIKVLVQVIGYVKINKK